MDYVPILLRVGWMAGVEGRRRRRRLVGDPHGVRGHDLRARHPVRRPCAADVEDDEVARAHLVDVTEGMVVGDAMAGHDGVARLPGEGGSRPGAGAAVDVAERHTWGQ